MKLHSSVSWRVFGNLLLLSLVWACATFSKLPAQGFLIDGVQDLSPVGTQITFVGTQENYYILEQTESISELFVPRQMVLGIPGAMRLLVRNPETTATLFVRVRQQLTSTPLDSDRDGIDDVYELKHKAILDPLNAADADADPDGDGDTTLKEYQLGTDPTAAPVPLTTIVSSPSNGEVGVAVTRETIIRFSNPLATNTVLDSRFLSASMGNRTLLSRVEVSSDRTKATLFYLENLPGAARIRVHLAGDGLLDAAANPVDADGDGLPGGTTTIEFETLGTTPLSNTIVCGRVFASELGDGRTSVNVPLGGVTISADGLEESVRAVTDNFGNFRITNAPPGAFFVHIDGRTVTNLVSGVRYPDLAYYPYVGKQWVSIPSSETNIGDVYLPRVAAGTLTAMIPGQPTRVEFPQSILEKHPEFAGTYIDIPADALYSDNGSRGGRIGIAPVPPDRLPEPLPPGLAFSVVITAQTDGPMNFDRPVPVCFPNLPDPITGRPLLPGEKTALWSFNHDLGKWQVMGPMTASADGKSLCTDPGVGILQPGWNGAAPGVNGGGGPPTCSLMEPPVPEGYEVIDNRDVYKVRLFSGEFFESVVDLRVQNVGFDIEWRRQYRSRFAVDSDQGNSWDFSYNIQLADDGDGVRVVHGATREDLFRPREQEKWVYNGYFRELEQNADGGYTQTFDDQTKWYFLPRDGTPAGGKISRMEDRYRNALEFTYNPAGQITRVANPDIVTGDGTPIRRIDVYYRPDGFIDYIEAPGGRIVRYEYYDDKPSEPNLTGNPGDLKRVVRESRIRPAGDFLPSPDVETVYTYSTGAPDRQLNHNLLTIRSGGILWLENRYGTNGHWEGQIYDRVLEQRWGDRTNRVEIAYRKEKPSSDNGDACSSAIVKNRNDYVAEFFYDAGNRLTQHIQRTGKNGAGRSTLMGAIAGPYVTKFGYNHDNQPTNIFYPNGSRTEYTYQVEIDSAASSRVRGNLRSVQRRSPESFTTLVTPEHNPLDYIFTERYEYKGTFGSRFFGLPMKFVTKYTDARTNSIVNSYDDEGNLVRRVHRLPTIVEDFTYNDRGQQETHTLPDDGAGWRRVDRFTYYLDGYQKEEIVDDNGLKLITRFEYDEVGNIIKRTDARTNSTEFIYSTADRIVRELSRPVLQDTRYQKDFAYDKRGNLTQVDILNLDELGNQVANAILTTKFEYDSLSYLIRKSQEVRDGDRSDAYITTEIKYDPNRNIVLTRSGEAVAGRQPFATVAKEYYERDQLARVTRAPGAPEESGTAYDYDSMGNLVIVVNGLGEEDQRTTNSYDGFNRLVRISDPMGNVANYRYDKNGNRVRTQTFGELVDRPGSTDNRLLGESTSQFDEEDRLVQSDTAFFDPATGQPFGDGLATFTTDFSPASQILRTIDDRGNTNTTSYDTAGRANRIVDAEGNARIFERDGNGNVTLLTERDISQRSGETQVFRTRNRYDNLDRLIETTDSSGNVRSFGYDSRNNVTVQIDGNRNVTRLEYDGVDRLVRTTQILTDSGLGSGISVGEIHTARIWDDNSRLVSEIDDHEHATTYKYDPLDRRTETRYADGTFHSTFYDVFNNPVRRRDANGTEVRIDYDLLNRLVRKDVTPGPQVENTTTFEEYTYDGRSRVMSAGNDFSRVRRNYNSLGAILSERLEPRGEWRVSLADEPPPESVVTYQWDSVGNLQAVKYPSGSQLEYDYDRLNRVTVIRDGQQAVVDYDYVGTGRVHRRTLGNGTWTDYRHDGNQEEPNPTGDFGVKRIVEIIHYTGLAVAPGLVERQRFTWDAAANKTLRTTTLVGARTNLYQYDSVNRLVSSVGFDGVTWSTNTYQLDGLGNRLAFLRDGSTNSYFLSETNPPADFQVNQYTQTPTEARAYDDNGNLAELDPTIGPKRTALHDYQNRLVGVDSEGLSVRFLYDVFGRRLQKTVKRQEGNSDPVFEVGRFRYAGERICEESDRANHLVAMYVWGRLIDELLHVRRAGTNYFYHGDDQGNVMAVSDATGVAIERYDYADYGAPSIYDPKGLTRPHSAIGNSYLFQGHRIDVETELYDFRARYLDPIAGRFVQRDPMGYVDGMSLFTFAGNNPWSRLDPRGLDDDEEPEVATKTDSVANVPSPVPEPQPAPTPTAGGSLDTTAKVANAVVSGVANIPGAIIGGAATTVTSIADLVYENSETDTLRSELDWSAEADFNDLGGVLGVDFLYDSSIDPYERVERGVTFFGSMGLIGWARSKLQGGTTPSIEPKPVANTIQNGKPDLRAKTSGYLPKDPLPQQNVGGVDIPLPHPKAMGPHTTLGRRIGSDGVPYRQSATFPGKTWPRANGHDVPWSRVDWTDHNRPWDHTNPHQHIFKFNGSTWESGPQIQFFPRKR